MIELDPSDADQTRVRVSMFGYQAGEAFDTLFGQFDTGNAWTLTQLAQRVTSGPTDWRALALTAAAPGDVE